MSLLGFHLPPPVQPWDAFPCPALPSSQSACQPKHPPSAVPGLRQPRSDSGKEQALNVPPCSVGRGPAPLLRSHGKAIPPPPPPKKIWELHPPKDSAQISLFKSLPLGHRVGRILVGAAQPPTRTLPCCLFWGGSSRLLFLEVSRGCSGMSCPATSQPLPSKIKKIKLITAGSCPTDPEPYPDSSGSASPPPAACALGTLFCSAPSQRLYHHLIVLKPA